MRKFASLLVLVAMTALLAACSCCRRCRPERAYVADVPVTYAANWPYQILITPNPATTCARWPASIDRFNHSGAFYLEQVIGCAVAHARCNPRSRWLDVAQAADDCRDHRIPHHAHTGTQWTCDRLLRHARNAYLNACGTSPSDCYCLSELNHEDGELFRR